MRSEKLPVLTNEEIAKDIYLLTLPYTSKILPRAGQFVMLKQAHATTLLSRAISVCDVADETLTLLYQVVGEGTKQLTTVRPGEKLTVTGPVGNGFPVGEAKGRVALVGGGVGVAPLLYTARKLKDKKLPVDIYLGFRDETYLVNEFANYASHLVVSTESGRSGTKGRVTEGLDPSQYDAIYCCGPTPMMEAVMKLCDACGTPIYVSLETKMACGIGACRVCTCTTKDGKNLRTCMEGPVFLGEELDLHA